MYFTTMTDTVVTILCKTRIQIDIIIRLYIGDTAMYNSVNLYEV